MIKEKNILINYCLYLAFFLLVIFIGVSDVFAYTYSEIANVTNKTTLLVEPSYSSSPFTVPVNSSYNFNSVKKIDIIVDNYSFQANTNYQLEFALTNQTLEFANTMGVTGANGEICKMDANASLLSGAWLYFAFQCTQATSTITIEVKNINNTDLWSGSGIFSWDKAVLRSAPEPIGTTPTDTDNIINNQNANTQSIIDNQNNLLGTKCTNLLEHKMTTTTRIGVTVTNNNDGSFTINGTTTSADGFRLNQSSYNGTDNLKNYEPGTYTLSINQMKPGMQLVVMQNSTWSNYKLENQNTSRTITFNSTFTNAFIYIYLPNNTTFNNYTIKPMFSKGTNTTFCEYGSTISKLDETNSSINGLNDTLKDDNVDENGVASAFEDFNDYLDDNSTITQLIAMPITLYTAILNNVNGTCQPFNLGSLFGTNLILPCINVSQYLGNSLWTMIDVIISGFAIFAIAKKMIKVFNNFSSLRDGDVIDD